MHVWIQDQCGPKVTTSVHREFVPRHAPKPRHERQKNRKSVWKYPFISREFTATHSFLQIRPSCAKSRQIRAPVSCDSFLSVVVVRQRPCHPALLIKTFTTTAFATNTQTMKCSQLDTVHFNKCHQSDPTRAGFPPVFGYNSISRRRLDYTSFLFLPDERRIIQKTAPMAGQQIVIVWIGFVNQKFLPTATRKDQFHHPFTRTAASIVVFRIQHDSHHTIVTFHRQSTAKALLPLNLRLSSFRVVGLPPIKTSKTLPGFL